MGSQHYVQFSHCSAGPSVQCKSLNPTFNGHLCVIAVIVTAETFVFKLPLPFYFQNALFLEM